MLRPAIPLCILLLLLSWATPGLQRVGFAATGETGLQFDGVDDYVLIPNSASLQDVTNQSFSLTAWVNPRSAPATDCVVNNSTCVAAAVARPGWHTYIGSVFGGRFLAGIHTSSHVSVELISTPVVPGGWHHLSLTVDDQAKQMSVYVDGAPVAGSPRSYAGTLYDHGAAPYYIGAASPFTTEWRWPFNGAIGEVRIYGRALQAQEVAAQYASGRGVVGGPESGLVGGWHLDEGAGTVASDYSGHGNVGSLNGPIWISGVVGNVRARIPAFASYFGLDLSRMDEMARRYDFGVWHNVPRLRQAVQELKQRKPPFKAFVYRELFCVLRTETPLEESIGNYDWINANHPEWFQKNIWGGRIEVPDYPGRWVMDVGNPAWQDFWIQQTLPDVVDSPWDGVFADDALTSIHAHNLPPMAGYPDDASYQRACLAFLAKITAAFHARGKQVIANVANTYDYPGLWDRFLNVTDGLMEEHFRTGWAWGPQNSWKQLEQVQSAERQGKWVFCITYGPWSDRTQMASSFAAYLLETGSHTFWSYRPYENADNPAWDQSWEPALGLPLAAAEDVGLVRQRRFQGGVVAVNLGTSSQIWWWNGQSQVLPSHEGIILQQANSNRPPVLNAVGNKTVVAGQPLSFALSATDSDNEPLTYSAAPLPAGASFNASTRTFSWTPGSAQAGSYRVTFTVSDGNLQDSESITVTVTAPSDTTPPMVTITAPAVGESVPSSGFAFQGTATDSSGVNEVRIYIYDSSRRIYTVSNALATYTAGTGAWSFSVLSSYVTAGSARLWVQAIDTKNNISTWQSRDVSVAGGIDTTSPSVSITTPALWATVPTSGLTFGGTASDLSGVREVRIYLYDFGRNNYPVSNALAELTPATSTWTFAVLPAHLTAGASVRLWVQAIDTAGNASRWQARDVHVVGAPARDVTPPSLTITTPLPSAIVPASGFTFSGIATDASGVREIRAYLYDVARNTYSVSNALVDYTARTANWSLRVLPGQVTSGAHARLWVQANDSQGNVTGWVTRDVSVR